MKKEELDILKIRSLIISDLFYEIQKLSDCDEGILPGFKIYDKTERCRIIEILEEAIIKIIEEKDK